MDLIKLFAQTSSGVAQLVHLKNGKAAGFGSGFFVKGKLVTNYHVAAAALDPANAADSLAIRFHDDAASRPELALRTWLALPMGRSRSPKCLNSMERAVTFFIAAACIKS